MEYIYNITFAVDASREGEMANSLMAEFIPAVTAEGVARNPVICRVEDDMAASADDSGEEPVRAVSLCVQLRFPSRDAVDHWADETLPDGIAALYRRFGQNLLFFPTVLRVLEPHNFN